MIDILVAVINIVANTVIFLIVAYSLVLLFVSPYHPVRQTLSRLVDPILAPIRKVMPAVGPFDFSPVILILVVGFLEIILKNLLYALR